MREYRIMTEGDINDAVKLYIDYYNTCEECSWTEETTYKRIRQVYSREDSYCLSLYDGNRMLAFVMGYFEQYDDGFAYDLVEIVVSRTEQGKGIGKAFMRELEARVKEKGALLIQLQSVNDDFHEHFYSAAGFKTCSNLVLKSKVL